jgi:hypothetical protein
MLIASTWLSTEDNLYLLPALTLMSGILLSPTGFNRPQIINYKPLRSHHFAVMMVVFVDLYTLDHWHAQLFIACPLLQGIWPYCAKFSPSQPIVSAALSPPVINDI